MSRGDDVWVGNCVESGCRPSHLESALFGLRAQMSGFLPYPGLLIPSLACSRALILRSITSSDREAALHACCALF